MVAGVHTGIELRTAGHLQAPFDNSLAWTPVALFIVPVVYAALNFGFAGSVATALWCTIAAVPNFLIFHHGPQLIAEIVQLGIVDAIAVLVGQRVDREMSARQRAEAAGVALEASESRYRGLFESSPIPILVLDSEGSVLEANPAANALFGGSTAGLKGISVSSLIGNQAAAKIVKSSPDGDENDDSQDDAYLVLTRGDGSHVYLAPIISGTGDRANPDIEVLLKDVTVEHYRQAGLRAYAAHILQIQEEERKRIAQELHDDTVQELVLLCRRLDLVESASERLPESATRGLRLARESAETAVRSLRGFARALRPPILDDLGLMSPINRLLSDLTERAGIDAEMKEVGEERKLPPDTALALFRIAQEALRNVEHHAQATSVTVTVDFLEGIVKLSVADNGVGFVLPPGQDFVTSGKLGLLGMRERAEALGGRLDIQSRPGEGTVLTASIPVGDGAITSEEPANSDLEKM